MTKDFIWAPVLSDPVFANGISGIPISFSRLVTGHYFMFTLQIRILYFCMSYTIVQHKGSDIRCLGSTSSYPPCK